MTLLALSSSLSSPSFFCRNSRIRFSPVSRISSLNGDNKLTISPPQFLNAGASLRRFVAPGKFPSVRLRVLTRCEKENAPKGGIEDDAERFARRESTMPDRFRYLTKEAPDSPIIWPWFVGTFLLTFGFVLVTVNHESCSKFKFLDLKFIIGAVFVLNR